MTTIIDASALVAYCLNEDGLDKDKVKEHLRRGAVSLDLLRAESANAILVSKRRKITEKSVASLALSSMLQLSTNNIKMVPQDDELISDAFEMSEDSKLAIYDLLYLSLAKRMNGTILSTDANQVKEATRMGIAAENASK